MTAGQVYFIECAGRIKIGTTKNLKARLAALQTSAPGDMIVVATIPGDRAVERSLHAQLVSHRVKLEWFDDCSEVRAAISVAVDLYGGTFSPEITALPPESRRSLPAPPSAASLMPWHTINRAKAAVLSATMSEVNDRFTALVKSDVAQDGCRASEMAHSFGLATLPLIEQIYRCDDPIGSYGSAVRLLTRLHHKFRKVSDRASLAIMDGDVSASTPLCRAAQILIDRAEAAFAGLCHHKVEMSKAA